ncbi:MAG: LytTR family DNA-binding domain-containing protein [Oscillospiraceae bacterium]
MLKLCICGNSEFREKMIEKTSDYFDRNDIFYSLTMYQNLTEVPFDEMEFNLVILDARFCDNSKRMGLLKAEEIFSKYSDMNVILITDLVAPIFRTRSLAFIPRYDVEKELIPTLALVIDKIRSCGNSYIFNFKGRKLKICLKDITYIESIKHDIYIHLVNNKTEKVSSTLECIEKNLSEFGFIRIHIGYIVNCEAVFSVDSKNVTLKDGTLLPVSRRRIEYVKEKFAMFSK